MTSDRDDLRRLHFINALFAHVTGQDLYLAEQIKAAITFSLAELEAQTAAHPEYAAKFDAAFTKDPAISTGAGDNFNAGYALGAALDLELPHRLALGAANSGFYVRNRTPTTLDQLVKFLREMPEPEFH